MLDARWWTRLGNWKIMFGFATLLQTKSDFQIHNFHELIIWQKARQMVKMVYQAVNGLPESERFALSSQIKRSAISIPSNIAEGAGRTSNKEFNHFLAISQGSSFELETQLLLACDLNYLKETEIQSIFKELREIQKINRTLQLKFK